MVAGVQSSSSSSSPSMVVGRKTQFDPVDGDRRENGGATEFRGFLQCCDQDGFPFSPIQMLLQKYCGLETSGSWLCDDISGHRMKRWMSHGTMLGVRIWRMEGRKEKKRQLTAPIWDREEMNFWTPCRKSGTQGPRASFHQGFPDTAVRSSASFTPSAGNEG